VSDGNPCRYLAACLAARYDVADVAALTSLLYAHPLQNADWARRWWDGEEESLLADLPTDVLSLIGEVPL
jgi:hypothetical protein